MQNLLGHVRVCADGNADGKSDTGVWIAFGAGHCAGIVFVDEDFGIVLFDGTGGVKCHFGLGKVFSGHDLGACFSIGTGGRLGGAGK